MKAYLVLLLVAIVHRVIAVVTETNPPVLELTDATFSQALQTHDEVFVDFYAKWCGTCKRLEPEFTAAAEQMSGKSNVQFAKVDIDENPGLAGQFFITRLPTLYHIRNNEVRRVPVSLRRYEITKFVRESEWQDIKPWNRLFSPLSIIGSAVFYFATFVKWLSTMPYWFFGVVIAGFIAIFAVSFWVEMHNDVQKHPQKDSARPATKQKTRKTRKID
ncbi:hypothetical protein BZG36_05181 [Bifiguratus adelaidae]|uniref:Thioredoxin domain-containing protein n=1 Tax=Bifiguratus adelaidae TaxID=1938954 RepID=A0A261XTP4_9FUNG|nr:hypothetical protein BZG36_05181 [Bifiguratus adelaidae]